MSLENEVSDGHKARQILEDKVFKGAVERIESSLLRGIEQTAFTDEKAREKLCQSYTLLKQLLRDLESVMETGQMAERQISLMERAKSFIKAA
jgi:ParB-like chromosome segregation protein Spo0J